MKVFVVVSQCPEEECYEIELVTLDEKQADDYTNEMDECCTQGKWYSVQEWEV